MVTKLESEKFYTEFYGRRLNPDRKTQPPHFHSYCSNTQLLLTQTTLKTQPIPLTTTIPPQPSAPKHYYSQHPLKPGILINPSPLETSNTLLIWHRLLYQEPHAQNGTVYQRGGCNMHHGPPYELQATLHNSLSYT